MLCRNAALSRLNAWTTDARERARGRYGPCRRYRDRLVRAMLDVRPRAQAARVVVTRGSGRESHCRRVDGLSRTFACVTLRVAVPARWATSLKAGPPGVKRLCARGDAAAAERDCYDGAMWYVIDGR